MNTDTPHTGKDFADLENDAAINEAVNAVTPPEIVQWPAPDMAILNNNRRPAVAMPLALFGSTATVLQDVGQGTSTAVD